MVDVRLLALPLPAVVAEREDGAAELGLMDPPALLLRLLELPELQLLLLHALLPVTLPLPLSLADKSRFGRDRDRYEGLKKVWMEEEEFETAVGEAEDRMEWVKLENRRMVLGCCRALIYSQILATMLRSKYVVRDRKWKSISRASDPISRSSI